MILFCDVIISAICDEGANLSEDDLIVGNTDVVILLGGADKSLARPGKKQATATKLGIYSTSSYEAQYTS